MSPFYTQPNVLIFATCAFLTILVLANALHFGCVIACFDRQICCNHVHSRPCQRRLRSNPRSSSNSSWVWNGTSSSSSSSSNTCWCNLLLHCRLSSAFVSLGFSGPHSLQVSLIHLRVFCISGFLSEGVSRGVFSYLPSMFWLIVFGFLVPSSYLFWKKNSSQGVLGQHFEFANG